MIVVAPTQSLKTTGLAIPAVLEWAGPVVAASVKTDLLRDTLARRRAARRRTGLRPDRSHRRPELRWTPLAGCPTWARRAAHGGVADRRRAARAARRSPTRDFWYAAAAKLLAPVLLAAATSDRTMADVVRWIDTQEEDEVRAALEAAGDQTPAIAARSELGARRAPALLDLHDRRDRARGLRRPGVLAAADTLGHHRRQRCSTAARTRSTSARPRTSSSGCGRCSRRSSQASSRRSSSARRAPASRSTRRCCSSSTRPRTSRRSATSTRSRPRRPGQGIQLVSVFQDLAQLRERWGGRAGSIVNNHRARIFGAGHRRPRHARLRRPAARRRARSASTPRRRARTARGPRRSRAASARSRQRTSCAQGRPGRAVLVYGHLPPAQLELRPWFADRALRARSPAQARAGADS